MGQVAYGSREGRGILVATIVASGIAFLDQTVVNVALPVIGRSLGTGLAGLQWTVDAYLLTLTAFLLPAGALGDRVGRRRVFLFGLVSFAVASALCGLAPGPRGLVLARAVQGLAAALLVPGSLAILRASFRPEDAARAIGTWAGLSGVSTALGPLAGGWLAEAFSWRAIFFVNAPLAAIALRAALRHVPESRDPGRGGVLAGGAGVAALAALLAVEARRRDPMLPLSLFAARTFSAVNGVTLAVYFALGGAAFLAVLQLQVGLGWSPLAAGAALTPLTLLVLAISPVAARLCVRAGPRPLLVGGPLVCAAGLALLARVDAGARYAADVLPGVAALGIGLGLTVAPLTTAVLEAAPPERAGIASAVNNAVARLAGLLAVAALPLAGGISAAHLAQGTLGPGYRRAMLLATAVAALGGVVAAATLAPTPAARPRARGAPAGGRPAPLPAPRDRTPPPPRAPGAPPGSLPRG